MSHHYSGPDFGFPHGDARLDLTDLYAFPKPGEADKSILIMNVHPSAVVDPPGSEMTSRRSSLCPGQRYSLRSPHPQIVRIRFRTKCGEVVL
jgi:hypothetical protein